MACFQRTQRCWTAFAVCTGIAVGVLLQFAERLTPCSTAELTLAVCVIQAVRAAAEAQQTPSGAEAGPLPLRAGPKLTSLRKPPAAAKPIKAKPVIIRKRAQPSTDEEAQQVGAAENATACAILCTVHSLLHCCCVTCARPTAAFGLLR